MKQSALAHEIGVEPMQVSRWENEHDQPRAGNLAAVAKLLGTSVEWLLTGEGDAPPSVAAAVGGGEHDASLPRPATTGQVSS